MGSQWRSRIIIKCIAGGSSQLQMVHSTEAGSRHRNSVPSLRCVLESRWVQVWDLNATLRAAVSSWISQWQQRREELSKSRRKLHLSLECFFFFFCLFRTTPVAYGSFHARGRIRAVAANLHHSHSNIRS